MLADVLDAGRDDDAIREGMFSLDSSHEQARLLSALPSAASSTAPAMMQY
jgi:hypothetical protein